MLHLKSITKFYTSSQFNKKPLFSVKQLNFVDVKLNIYLSWPISCFIFLVVQEKINTKNSIFTYNTYLLSWSSSRKIHKIFENGKHSQNF